MRKKVLFVATITRHIEGFHTPLLKLFKEKGWEVQVATGDKKKISKYCDKKYTISIERSPYKLKNLKAIKELKKIIDKENYDIIHCHTPMGSVVARLAARHARKNGTRVIYTAHGFHFFKGAPLINWLLFYPVEKYLAKYTDTLITINKEDYELAKSKFSGKCKDIEYVPGVGIDTKKFNIAMSEKEKLELREKVGLKNNDYILTCVARLDKNKNQEFLINAMQKIVIMNNNIHLLLVGPDELNGKYKKKVKKYKLENNIHFLGRREDVPQLLAISNVVVSSSLREGLPVNIMEALESGLPVVALKCRGMEDLIINGKNGYIVNDQKEFIDRVLQLENKKLKNISLNATFLVENVCKKMAKIYFKGSDISDIIETNVTINSKMC